MLLRYPYCFLSLELNISKVPYERGEKQGNIGQKVNRIDFIRQVYDEMASSFQIAGVIKDKKSRHSENLCY